MLSRRNNGCSDTARGLSTGYHINCINRAFKDIKHTTYYKYLSTQTVGEDRGSTVEGGEGGGGGVGGGG